MTDERLNELVGLIIGYPLQYTPGAYPAKDAPLINRSRIILNTVWNEAIDECYKILHDWQITEKDIDVTLLNLILAIKKGENK